jgi:hypothetical protein
MRILGSRWPSALMTAGPAPLLAKLVAIYHLGSVVSTPEHQSPEFDTPPARAAGSDVEQDLWLRGARSRAMSVKQ